ncbi:hypothetical protein BDR03DRAFT_1019306 [Suillus americanus]|nr:hypothetical protein BDR03DRAFT_1019306 [Suillus americanus]
MLNLFYRFVDRDMFMRYRGGGVGHKSICEATKCLLDDRDALDKLPFTIEKEREARDSDDEMVGTDVEDSDDDPAGEDEDEDIEGEDGEDGNENEDEGSSEDQDDEDDGDGIRDPLTTEHLIDDDIADEMDEFGYTGLDQVLVDDDLEDDDALLDEDALGAEDGEEGGLNHEEAEGTGFTDL